MIANSAILSDLSRQRNRMLVGTEWIEMLN